MVKTSHELNYLLRIAWLFLLLLCAADSVAQSASSLNPLQVSFVKPIIQHEAGRMSFNVLKIINPTSDSINLKVTPELSEQWTLVNQLAENYTVNPGDSLFIPVRFTVPLKLNTELKQTIVLGIFDQYNNLNRKADFALELPTIHQWELEVPEQRIRLFPRITQASFEIKLINNGNTAESIAIDIVKDKKLTLISNGQEISDLKFEMKAFSDTTIPIQILYAYKKERVFDIAKIQFFASNGEQKVYRSVIAEKYTDNYAPFTIEQGLMHSTEVGMRTFSRNNEVLPYIKARGTTEFGEGMGDLKYNFTFYDLTSGENLIGNTYYNFLYTNNAFKVGLGAFSSMLGRNLYNRNSLMLAHEIKLGPESSMEGFVSYGFLDKKMSGGIGYQFHLKEIPMKITMAQAQDQQSGKNTSSFTYKTEKIPISKKQAVSLNLYAYQEKYYKNENYALRGFAYDLNYLFQMTKDIDIQVLHNYGSPGIPGMQMGLLNFYIRTNYAFDRLKKSAISMVLFSTERKFHQRNFEGIELPQTIFKDQYAGIFYKNAAFKKFRFDIGPSFENYFSSRPKGEDNIRESFYIEKYRVELKTFFLSSFMFQVKYGISRSNYVEPTLSISTAQDLHILLDAKAKSFGLRFSYDKGALSNSGLYQFISENSQHSINLSPFVMKTFWDGRVKFNLFSNFLYRIDLEYYTLNINPRLELYLGKNWYAVSSGTYNMVRQKFAQVQTNSSHYYFEFAIKKNWGRNAANKWSNDMRKLTIQLFKDENGNGIKERNEQGLPNVSIRIVLINSDKLNRNNSLPVDIILVTNSKGYVNFNKLPSGIYQVTLAPLESIAEYFYVGTNTDNIELLNDKSLKIPFQKANKVSGKITVARQKFIKDSEQNIPLENIKITAYNKLGNNYSVFTDSEGNFTLYLPGSQLYYVRMNNIFGPNFIIRDNDIEIQLTQKDDVEVVFEVIEKSRAINFKKVTTPKPKEDEYKMQKIKVLAGSVNRGDTLGQPMNSEPAFNPTTDNGVMQTNRYYVLLAKANNIAEAMNYRKIYSDRNLIVNFGFDEGQQKIYLYTNSYLNREEANAEVKKLNATGIHSADLFKYKP
ncbi:MAG: hypothetical protein PF694_06755 [Bacteroidetes bacterium]|jgi:hypothetical protein|nr:hypothetical protein [Bacteroidota bacterium]